MEKMFKEMINNYKTVIDAHVRDFENGCYDDSKEYRKVIHNEYETLCDTFYGLSRYDAITINESKEMMYDCFAYAMAAMHVLRK